MIRQLLLMTCASCFFFATTTSAELQSIADESLSEVTGQSGVYLSGEITINEAGGPLADNYFGLCADAGKVCGARIAMQTEQSGGWFVIDNLRGGIAFEGLTMRIREINSGFGGDGALFNRDVLEIGMPESIRFDEFQFTLAGSATERPSDAGFEQVDLFGVEMSGEATLQGNLLVFPTD
jgi:hypothetical protein